MSLRLLILSTLFAVLTAVSAVFVIPLPIVPITLQTAVVLASGLMLGAKGGALSQAFYLLLGLLGLPVLAGGCGGLHHIFDPTFGFNVGFIPAAGVVGFLGSKFGGKTKRKFAAFFIACLFGILTYYAFGLPVLFLNLKYVAQMDVGAAKIFQIGFLPFVIPDILKACFAAAIAVRCSKLLKL